MLGLSKSAATLYRPAHYFLNALGAQGLRERSRDHLCGSARQNQVLAISNTIRKGGIRSVEMRG